MSWRYKFLGRYKNIALKMSLSLGSDDSFNLYLQKSIAGGNQALVKYFFEFKPDSYFTRIFC